jgi:hypothetical protein
VIVASYERDSSNPDDVSSQSCPKPPPPTTREPHIDAPTIPTTNTLTWINAAPPHPTKEPLDIPTSFNLSHRRVFHDLGVFGPERVRPLVGLE